MFAAGLLTIVSADNIFPFDFGIVLMAIYSHQHLSSREIATDIHDFYLPYFPFSLVLTFVYLLQRLMVHFPVCIEFASFDYCIFPCFSGKI